MELSCESFASVVISNGGSAGVRNRLSYYHRSPVGGELQMCAEKRRSFSSARMIGCAISSLYFCISSLPLSDLLNLAVFGP
jgi:hypothetical protein